MNKDYHNTFAPDIWCLFGASSLVRRYHPLHFDIFVLTYKDAGYYNFPVFAKPGDENIQT